MQRKLTQDAVCVFVFVVLPVDMNARYIRATSGVVLKAFCPISVQKSVKEVSTLSSFLACAEVRCSERVVEVILSAMFRMSRPFAVIVGAVPSEAAQFPQNRPTKVSCLHAVHVVLTGARPVPVMTVESAMNRRI